MRIAGRKEHNEIFNASSHFVGFLLAVAGFVALIVYACRQNNKAHIISFSIYGATLCFLYLSSSVYHFSCVFDGGRAKKILQKIDHCAIYLLIAGSYTPICVIALKGGWGVSLLSVIWGLAAFGVILKIVLKNADSAFTYALYGIMGWLAVVAIFPIFKNMIFWEILLLFLGGLSYTIGAILLALKKPRIKPGIFSYHELWHIFVMSGSAFHFALMICFVQPG